VESFVSASDAGLCDEQRRSRMNSELNTEEPPIRISSFWRLRLDWEHSIEVQCNLLDIIKRRSVPVVHIVNSDFKGVVRNVIQSTYYSLQTSVTSLAGLQSDGTEITLAVGLIVGVVTVTGLGPLLTTVPSSSDVSP